MTVVQDQLIQFKKITDQRGSLIAVEEERNIPFAIKRVYYIFDTKGDEPRGFHAHKKLQQALICLRGSCKVLLEDESGTREVILNDPSEALYVGPGVWHEMHDFTDDFLMMVLASDYYDESDYIRSYQEFTEYLKSHKF